LDIAVFPILADPDKNNLQPAQLLIGWEVVSGRMDGCRASVLHSCSCRDRPKLGGLQYGLQAPCGLCKSADSSHAVRYQLGRSGHRVHKACSGPMHCKPRRF